MKFSRFSAVRDRVEKANGMTVLQAMQLKIYTLQSLMSDEFAGYISLYPRETDVSVRSAGTPFAHAHGRTKPLRGQQQCGGRRYIGQ